MIILSILLLKINEAASNVIETSFDTAIIVVTFMSSLILLLIMVLLIMVLGVNVT